MKCEARQYRAGISNGNKREPDICTEKSLGRVLVAHSTARLPNGKWMELCWTHKRAFLTFGLQRITFGSDP